ncbi:MAG TPA: alpha/beta fold hydrolase [Vicinamibacteria bacterium]|nr:alpha/beta fold hydrolase [Vicinamibacteria bacterium]
MRLATAWRVSVLCAAVTAAPAAAQDRAPDAPPAPREAELKSFMNIDAKDAATKLDLLVHTLYEVNQKLVAVTFSQRYGDRIRMERVMIPNGDRDTTPGWIFRPLHMEGGRRYPGVTLVHGAFHGSFDEDMFVYVDRLVREGYAVIVPEYRGSRGYGAEHYHAQEYGGRDTDDVMAGTDLLAGKPYSDPQRQAIVGWSRGGLETLLALQRAPRKYRAAVDVAGLADFLMYMAYKPEYRRQEVARESQFKGMPFERLEAYMAASPILHVAKIETPLLILATTHDETVPHQLHSERLAEALRAHGKTFEYKLYEHAPGGHSFVDADTPEARDALDRIVAFLGKHVR